jgi:hypothetical protein
VGVEAWDTFQVSCNEFRSTIWGVCTGKNQFGTRMTCRGTHQGMPWQDVAAHGHATNLGLIAHGHAMAWHAVAHTKACHEKPWHTHQGMPWSWHPMGKPWHTPRHAWQAVAAHRQVMAHAVAPRGTHQGMSWQPMACHGTHQGMSWHIMVLSKACRGTHLCKSPSAPSLTSRCFRGQIDRVGWMGGGTNRSDTGLNLSGSWQQGHSATYNTPSRI